MFKKTLYALFFFRNVLHTNIFPPISGRRSRRPPRGEERPGGRVRRPGVRRIRGTDTEKNQDTRPFWIF